ncbi:uncharacterized protein LOC143301108 [Babylonia areolata]|uniref:uncharacterized protein LOC143301108 n=1 Tax=Babylonia areolata TaxID=304850 RepID=UPI003FCF5FF0
METDMEGPSQSGLMRRLEEGRVVLPWHLVKHNTWVKLANKLDLPSPVSNNDWKGLAEHLGFSTEDILVLDNTKERSTIALFTNYLPKKDSTVNNVAKALKKMNRDDALQILLDAVPDLEAQYEAQKSGTEAMEGTDSCVTTMAQGACGCLGPQTLSYGSQHHGGGGCSSPCHSHSHPRHPHPQHPSHCSLASGPGCCCRHVGNLHHYHHSPPASCSPHLHSHAPHAGRASPLALTSSGCRNVVGVGVGMSTHPVQNYNVSVAGSSHQEHSYNTHAGGGGGNGRGGDFYGSSSPSQQQQGMGRSPLQHQLRSSPIQQQLSDRAPAASYSEVMQESMVVHADMDSPHHGDLRSFLPGSSGSTTSMEVEEPALLHTAIVRGQGMVSLTEGQALPPALDSVDMGGEDNTPSTSVEELSSSDSGSRVSGLPLNVMRQVSEECNANQPLLPTSPSSATAARGMYSLGEDTDGMTPWGAEPPRGTARGGGGGGGEGQRNNARAGGGGGGQLSSAGGGVFGPSREGQSPLKKLENLAHLPSRFMPGNKFTTMVAEQQIEDIPPSHRGLRVNIKRERDSSRSCQFSGLTNSSGSASSRSKGLAGADTYPLRIKPQAGGSMVEEVRNRQPGMLMKTTSVPIDMKVEEFKKAFRHIKVFVTYANDNKHHSRQVLSLCNCLDRNGFSCCADVTSRHDSPEQQQRTREWCGRKFKEADFVLVFLSPLYLQEIRAADNHHHHHHCHPKPSNSNNNNNNSKAGEKGSLHAAYIYQLMQEEYLSSKTCSRFVPLYMDESLCGQGPPWLTGHLSYQWPRQYKDLLWMLTKPEDRIRQRARPSLDKGHHHGGGGVLRDKVNGRHGDPILSSPLN